MLHFQSHLSSTKSCTHILYTSQNTTIVSHNTQLYYTMITLLLGTQNYLLMNSLSL